MWLVYLTYRIYLLSQQPTPSLPLSLWSSTLAGTILLPFTRMASEPERDWITCGPGGSCSHGKPQVRVHGSLTILKKKQWIGWLEEFNDPTTSQIPCPSWWFWDICQMEGSKTGQRTQMLQQLSHVRNGQAKKDEGLQVETKAKPCIYIYIHI